MKKKSKNRIEIKRYLCELFLIVLMLIILFLYRDFLNANGNALMVLITFVYVVATIEICRASIQSAEASRAQLEESRRQFSETQRLGVLPYLSVTVGEPVFEKSSSFPVFDLYYTSLSHEMSFKEESFLSIGINVKNIGSGIACKIGTIWSLDVNKTIQPTKTTMLCVGADQLINATIVAEEKDKDVPFVAEIVFDYYDIIGNHYNQSLLLNMQIRRFNQHISLDTYRMQEPVFITNNNDAIS